MLVHIPSDSYQRSCRKSDFLFVSFQRTCDFIGELHFVSHQFLHIRARKNVTDRHGSRSWKRTTNQSNYDYIKLKYDLTIYKKEWKWFIFELRFRLNPRLQDALTLQMITKSVWNLKVFRLILEIIYFCHIFHLRPEEVMGGGLSKNLVKPWA